MVATLAVVASAAPVLAGCRHELAGWRLRVWGWLAFLCAENVVLRVMSWNDLPTGLVAWWCYPVSVALGVTALLSFEVTASLRWWRWPLILGYLACWLAAPVLGDGPGYSVFAAPLHALLLSGVGAVVLARSLDRPDHRPPAVAIATLLCYLPFVAVWPVSLYLTSVAPEWVLPLWEARAGVLIVGSLVYAVALW